MSGVKKSKAKKMQAEASSKQTTRTVKGKNKVEKQPRADKKKGAEKRAPQR